MSGLNGCGLNSLIRDTFERTLEVNRALAEGAGAQNNIVAGYLLHVEQNGIDITPQPKPLQIVGFSIGCSLCRGCTSVNLSSEFTTIQVPAECHVEGVEPGGMRMGKNLLSDAGQQG